MFRIERCQNRPALPEIQYVQSAGVEDKDDESDGKVTTYFFPSMVFPNRVEILSITLLCKCKHKETEEKIIKIAIHQNNDDTPKDLGEDYYLRHKSDHKKLVTTFKFPTAIVMDPDQPFYFYTKDDDMELSCLVLAFRNMD